MLVLFLIQTTMHESIISSENYLYWGFLPFKSFVCLDVLSVTNPNVLFFFSLSLKEVSVSNGPEAQSVPKEEEQEEQGEGSEDEWEQVGPRNKSSVTRQADFVQTPITDIFGGHIRYSTFSYKFLTCCG